MQNAKWQALIGIGTAVFLALSLWFSASVIMDELTLKWGMGQAGKAWISAAVPAGFAAGALASVCFGWADRLSARHFFAVSALAGAAVNLLILGAESAWQGILLRFLTGAALAGVYPPAVKVLTLWFPRQRGLAVGIMIGALTLGSSLPHFLLLFSAEFDWEFVIISSSCLSAAAAFIMSKFVQDAPASGNPATFSFSMIKKVLNNRPVMLANYGYFGHMWELYAVWTWLPVFFAEKVSFAPLLSFGAIGCAGAAGCIAGGLMADRIGRAKLTIWMMAASAFCCLIIGWAAAYSSSLFILVTFIWGFSVIADSAQFSAAVSEFADKEWLGTALTIQMSTGFLITIFSINLLAFIQPYMGWQWAFALLSLGPLLGIAAMAKLKIYEKAFHN